MALLWADFFDETEEAHKLAAEFVGCFLEASKVFAVVALIFASELLGRFFGVQNFFFEDVCNYFSGKNKDEGLAVRLHGLGSGDGVSRESVVEDILADLRVGFPTIGLAAESNIRNGWSASRNFVRDETGMLEKDPMTGERTAVNMLTTIRSVCNVSVMRGEPNDRSGMVACSPEQGWSGCWLSG